MEKERKIKCDCGGIFEEKEVNFGEFKSQALVCNNCNYRTLTKEQAEMKFGFLLNAYRYASAPHGGMGLGFDRLVALLAGTNDIREVIAFPKNKAAQCPMDGSPSEVDDKQLRELHIKTEVIKKTEKN